MLKKTIDYVNFNGEQKSKDCYFNLTRPELMEMKQSPLFEMRAIFNRIRNMEDPDNELSYEEKDEIQEKLGNILRDFVVMSYGIKSPDGERFVKRLGDDPYGQGHMFIETMAYDEFYFEMIQHPQNLYNFVREIIPESYATELDKNADIQELKKELDDGSLLSNSTNA